nr:NINE protein [Pseudoalteromonas sp. WY3]
MLAVFLGGFGVHKFYLGQIGLGFIYLLFFWTAIPAIIAFVEFIILLTMSDEAFNNKYGYD